jgi:aspartyl-tRNA(Asn)/glutamyl-tRNA(Gln) amidotransferase subunit B
MPSASAGEAKITDEKEIERFAKKIVEANAKAAADYKSGEKSAFNFLMGEVMKATSKRADFSVARKVLEKLLKK